MITPPITWSDLIVFLLSFYALLMIICILVLGLAMLRQASRISREEESHRRRMPTPPSDSGES